MKKHVRLLGLTVAAAAGYYFVRQAAVAWRDIDFGMLLSMEAAAFACAALLLYLAQVPLTAMIWRGLLSDLRVPMPLASAYAVIATTQFSKYLPGNVAHHIGRVVVARRFGGDVPKLTLSLIYENVIALLAGAHVTAVFLTLRPVPGIERWLPVESRLLLLVGATASAGLAFVLLPRLVGWLQRRRGLAQAADGVEFRLSPAQLLQTYFVFVASFLFLGLAFSLLAHVASPTGSLPFAELCGAFAAAWVIGTLVPGAPAGLGVREGVLLALLAGVTTSAAAVAAIALLRIVTTLGDAIHFAVGLWRLRSAPAGPPASR